MTATPIPYTVAAGSHQNAKGVNACSTPTTTPASMGTRRSRKLEVVDKSRAGESCACWCAVMAFHLRWSAYGTGVLAGGLVVRVGQLAPAVRQAPSRIDATAAAAVLAALAAIRSPSHAASSLTKPSSAEPR